MTKTLCYHLGDFFPHLPLLDVLHDHLVTHPLLDVLHDHLVKHLLLPILDVLHDHFVKHLVLLLQAPSWLPRQGPEQSFDDAG